MLAKAFENKKAETFVSAFCTQDNSVLEPFYKDLVLLYELRIPLKKEGLSDYPINPHLLRDKQTNILLQ